MCDVRAGSNPHDGFSKKCSRYSSGKNNSNYCFFRVCYCFGQTLTFPGFVVYYFTIICLQLTLPWKAILRSHLEKHSSSIDLHLHSKVREIRASDPLFIFPDKRVETIKRLTVSMKTMKTNVDFYYFFFFLVKMRIVLSDLVGLWFSSDKS